MPPPSQKKAQTTPKQSLVWALFWDGGGIEGGTLEVYQNPPPRLFQGATTRIHRYFRSQNTCLKWRLGPYAIIGAIAKTPYRQPPLHARPAAIPIDSSCTHGPRTQHKHINLTFWFTWPSVSLAIACLLRALHEPRVSQSGPHSQGPKYPNMDTRGYQK